MISGSNVTTAVFLDGCEDRDCEYWREDTDKTTT